MHRAAGTAKNNDVWKEKASCKIRVQREAQVGTQRDGQASSKSWAWAAATGQNNGRQGIRLVGWQADTTAGPQVEH
jgi:hypothetical protein